MCSNSSFAAWIFVANRSINQLMMKGSSVVLKFMESSNGHSVEWLIKSGTLDKPLGEGNVSSWSSS